MIFDHYRVDLFSGGLWDSQTEGYLRISDLGLRDHSISGGQIKMETQESAQSERACMDRWTSSCEAASSLVSWLGRYEICRRGPHAFSEGLQALPGFTAANDLRLDWQECKKHMPQNWARRQLAGSSRVSAALLVEAECILDGRVDTLSTEWLSPTFQTVAQERRLIIH